MTKNHSYMRKYITVEDSNFVPITPTLKGM